MGIEEEMRGVSVEVRGDGRGPRSTATGLLGSAKSWVEAVVGDITTAAKERSSRDRAVEIREMADGSVEATERRKLGVEERAAKPETERRRSGEEERVAKPAKMGRSSEKVRTMESKPERMVAVSGKSVRGTSMKEVPTVAATAVRPHSGPPSPVKPPTGLSDLGRRPTVTNRGRVTAVRNRGWFQRDRQNGNPGRSDRGDLRVQLGERRSSARGEELRSDRVTHHSGNDGSDGLAQRRSTELSLGTVEAKGGLLSHAHKEHCGQGHQDINHQENKVPLNKGKTTAISETQGEGHRVEE